MHYRKIFFVVLSAVTMVLSPLAARASCTQPDVAGNWELYLQVVTSTGADWIRCKVKIDGTGVIANTICDASTAATGTLSDAKIVLSKGQFCTFTGHFKTSKVLNSIDHLTLALNKQTGSGVGTRADGYFLITMTKL